MKKIYSPSTPLAKPALLAILMLLCLTVSGQANAQALTQQQQTVVNNLSTASGTIKGQLSLTTSYSAALQGAAINGTIVDPTAYTQATITEQQRLDYNASLSTFKTTDFYNAQQFFQQQAAVKQQELSAAVNQLTAATVDLQKTVAVHQQLQQAVDAPTAKAVQSVIVNSGIGSEVTQSQVAALTGSLAMVNSAATQAAAFMRSANSVQITQNVDAFKQAYGGNLAYANASFDYATGALAVAWDNMSITQTGVLENYKQSSQSFYQTVVYGAQ